MYKGEVVHVCFVIDAECAVAKAGKNWGCSDVNGCPIRDIMAKGLPNTYLDPDADDAMEDKGHKKHHPRWKFWERNEKDTD
jgi:hypothetical protein